MNLFILDGNPQLAARYHCDKHVVKMILETTQLLYTTHYVLQPDNQWIERFRKEIGEIEKNLNSSSLSSTPLNPTLGLSLIIPTHFPSC